MPVREGIMALLIDGPRHGYQLKTEFEAATGSVWPLNVGQVYTTLDRLERDGLVAHREHDGTKTYRLTADGREALGAWWETVTFDEPPPRDELMLKVLMAIERDRDHALAVITRQRTALLSMLQRRTREAQGDGADASLSRSLVADALVTRAEADLRWLDRCESQLVKAGREQ
jgi:DNA-binding PadR family transcriptional regulator